MKNGNKTIALLGQPNSGKSSLFNGLTGSRQHVEMCIRDRTCTTYPASPLSPRLVTFANILASPFYRICSFGINP